MEDLLTQALKIFNMFLFQVNFGVIILFVIYYLVGYFIVFMDKKTPEEEKAICYSSIGVFFMPTLGAFAYSMILWSFVLLFMVLK